MLSPIKIKKNNKWGIEPLKEKKKKKANRRGMEKNPLKIQAQQTCGCYQPRPAVWDGERAPEEEEEEETAALPLAEEQVWGCQPSAFLCRESGLRKTRRLQK